MQISGVISAKLSGFTNLTLTGLLRLFLISTLHVYIPFPNDETLSSIFIITKGIFLMEK